MTDGTHSYKVGDRVYTGKEVVEALRVYADGFDVPDEGHPLKEMDSGCLKTAREHLDVPRRLIASALGVSVNTVDNWLRNPCNLQADKASALLCYLADEYSKDASYLVGRARRGMMALEAFCERFIIVKHQTAWMGQRRAVRELENIFGITMLFHMNGRDALAQLASEFITGASKEAATADISPLVAKAYMNLHGLNRNAELYYFADAQREVDGISTPDNGGERWRLDDGLMENCKQLAARCLSDIESWVRFERDYLGLPNRRM